MKRRVLLLLAVFGSWLTVQVEAGTAVRDFSGEAMQRHESRMMGSPLSRIPSMLDMSLWPFDPYFYAPPSLTVVNVEIHLPTPDQATEPSQPPPPAAPPKFWTNRCGVFIEIEASQPTSLMKEENEPC